MTSVKKKEKRRKRCLRESSKTRKKESISFFIERGEKKNFPLEFDRYASQTDSFATSPFKREFFRSTRKKGKIIEKLIQCT